MNGGRCEEMRKEMLGVWPVWPVGGSLSGSPLQYPDKSFRENAEIRVTH